MQLPPPPFTPEMLAERWQCSGRQVRDLIARGKLAAFRVGRLIRIPVENVIEFERARYTAAAHKPAGADAHDDAVRSEAACLAARHVAAELKKMKPRP